MKVIEVGKLYEDTEKCAQIVGLTYAPVAEIGYSRRRHSNGFTYTDTAGHTIVDKNLKRRITELVIPPAWENVWISPDENGHILATGIDEKKRKQYMYHPKWRATRDAIKFYRILLFAGSLPKIRTTVTNDLKRHDLDRKKILALMLWLLDNTYIRIGNEQYATSNDSFGLTTLTSEHVVVAGSVTTLAFRGKSNKDQQITFDNQEVATLFKQLVKQPATRLFSYQDNDGYEAIESADVNAYLQEITGNHISAKDFRTWGGTLMAFNHLLINEDKPVDKTPKEASVKIAAIDAAANVLGNTRTVARSSYVHPDLLKQYGSPYFSTLHRSPNARRGIRGLDAQEHELVFFLDNLLEEEFDVLKNS